MPETSTILITGSAGFIGFHLANRLLSDGHVVIGFDNMGEYYPASVKHARLREFRRHGDNYVHVKGDLSDAAAVSSCFETYKPDIVCNLAAQAGVRYSILNPHAYLESNLAGFLNILECCRHHQPRRLVYASSSSVYGGNTKLPFSETDRVDAPISLYAATKKANELMAHSYSHLYGIQTIGLRFFTVYGPWGRPDMALWIFAEKILNGEPIPVFNNGDMKRDFTYIDDIVAGTRNALLMEKLAQNAVYNLGNHHTERLLDMIAILETALGKSAVLDYLPMQPGDVPETYADISAAQGDLAFRPATRIAAGIPAFCDWYRESPEIARDVYRWRRAGGVDGSPATGNHR